MALGCGGEVIAFSISFLYLGLEALSLLISLTKGWGVNGISGGCEHVLCLSHGIEPKKVNHYYKDL